MGATRHRRTTAEPEMGRAGTVIYLICLAIFGVLTLIALYVHLWWVAVVVAVMAIAFIYAGWFVLARAWRVRQVPRRRPVRRR